MPPPPSFLLPVLAWPMICELMGQTSDPWPDELAIADLRWHDDQLRRGYVRRMPGYRAFRTRWRWSEHQTRHLMTDEKRWCINRDTAAAPQQHRSSTAAAPQSGAEETGESSENHRNSTADVSRKSRTNLDTRVDHHNHSHSHDDPSGGPGGSLGLAPPQPLPDQLAELCAIHRRHAERWRWKDTEAELTERWPRIVSKIPKGLDVGDQVEALDAWLTRSKPKSAKATGVYWRRVSGFLTGRVAKEQASSNPVSARPRWVAPTRPAAPPAAPPPAPGKQRPRRMDYADNDAFRQAMQTYHRLLEART